MIRSPKFGLGDQQGAQPVRRDRQTASTSVSGDRSTSDRPARQLRELAHEDCRGRGSRCGARPPPPSCWLTSSFAARKISCRPGPARRPAPPLRPPAKLRSSPNRRSRAISASVRPGTSAPRASRRLSDARPCVSPRGRPGMHGASRRSTSAATSRLGTMPAPWMKASRSALMSSGWVGRHPCGRSL